MLKEIDLNIVTEFFQNDPALCILSLHDSDLVSLYKTKQLNERPKSKWHGIYHGDELIATVRTEKYTDDIVITHMYVSTEYRNQGLLKYLYTDLVAHLLDHTQYKKILVPVPKPCQHVVQAITKLGFELKNTIPKALTWREQIVDLLHFERDIIHAS